MVLVRGRLEPEVGALLRRALEAARAYLYKQSRTPAARDLGRPLGDPPTPPQRQADALALVAQAALRHALDPGPPGERYQVVIHVDAPVLADAEAAGQSVVERLDLGYAIDVLWPPAAAPRPRVRGSAPTRASW
jgi:hypothetical protein